FRPSGINLASVPGAPSFANSSGTAVGDLNGDGIPDQLQVESTVASVYLGRADLTYSGPTPLTPTPVTPAPHYITGAAILDWDNAGKPDTVMTIVTFGTGVFKGTGDGTFHPAALQFPGLGPTSPAGRMLVAQLTNDTVPDLVLWSVLRFGSTAVVV